MNIASLTPLLSGFAPATDADWRKVAEESLDGAPFEKKLITRTPEGIDLQPIYTRRDVEPSAADGSWPGLAPYTRGADALGSRPHGWLICQELGCSAPADFNAALREALERGQNAVQLSVASSPDGRGLKLDTLADVDAALHGVDLAAVPLFAAAGVTALPLAQLLHTWLRSQDKAAELHGGLLADPLTTLVRRGALPGRLGEALDDMATLTTWAQREGLRLRTIGVDAGQWAEAGGHAVQELAFGLATGIDYVRALDARGVRIDDAAPRVLFTFSLGSSFFMEIAKLRAARLLWARAVQAAGGSTEAQRLVSHGRTSRWNKTVLDPHVNLLRATTEACAGVIGGCSGLQVGAFDECYRAPDTFSRRLARNLQIILQEECQLGAVVDPAGGSWLVESLTRQLAAKAWALFQEIERRGGMAAAIRAGYPQELVKKNADERIAAVESRREGVIGTNLHPNLKEKLPAADSVVAATPSGAAEAAVPTITPRRRAEPFEVLRRRAEAQLARTGRRPTVFLAGFGPRKQHAARADFAAGFFAAGGFETISGKGLDSPAGAAQVALESGAPIVVICSTDETYPTIVPPLAQALKAESKPPLVVLAGLPAAPELQAQFKSAGVDAFIHLRANCAQLLATFQDKLGL